MKNENTMDMQLHKDNSLKHLLTMRGLPRETLYTILERAQQYVDDKQHHYSQLLHNKTIMNLFFEPSTRTRVSFELAAKRLGAEVINLDIKTSSMNKGESLFDTIHTLEAMRVDGFVIRHSDNDACNLIVNNLQSHAKIINAGSGITDHPTQALLDMLTIQQFKKSFADLKVAIVGDIKHSRVARSDLYALRTLGVNDIHLIAPDEFLPDDLDYNQLSVFDNIDRGLYGVDVIISLRIQRERMKDADFLDEESYHEQYGITVESLKQAKKDVIVMHPGPINRGVEIAAEVADGERSVILTQVSNGVAVRMAVMSLLLN